ncbi:Ca(2+)-dependent cysteine protease, partial [Nowakowskiella sp. JEL0078]
MSERPVGFSQRDEFSKTGTTPPFRSFSGYSSGRTSLLPSYIDDETVSIISEQYSSRADIDDDEVNDISSLSFYRMNIAGSVGNRNSSEMRFEEVMSPNGYFDEEEEFYDEEELMWNNHFLHGGRTFKRQGGAMKIKLDGLEFDVSDCTGTRKGLFVGINYNYSPHELQNCVDETLNFQNFIQLSYEVPSDNLLSLIDQITEPHLIPTKENILNGLRWLFCGAKAGDSLLIHFSGHRSSGTLSQTL